MMQNAALRRPAPLERLEDDEPPRPGRVLEHPAVMSRRLPDAPSRRGRGLSLLLAGAVVFGMFGGVVWYAYTQGGVGLVGDPPLVRAQPGPYKHVPENRGGLQVENQTASVINVFHPPASSEPPVAELLPPAPPPSRPDPTAGEQRITASDPTDLSKLPPLPAPTPPEPPLQALEAPDLPALQVPPPAATPPHAPAKAAAHAAPPRVEAAAPPPAREEPAPAAGPVAHTQHAPTVVATAAPGSDAAAPPAIPASTGSGYRLQLVSVKSEAAASQAWAQLRQRYPALASLSPSVERFATPSGTNYRLQAGPFPGFQAASAACTAIQAQGGQCIVTTAR